ncbi:IPT/TIG domain-containing protein [Flavobacterium daejeonense]|uniref:IPT/TIG domain-containing protein n=1 Tax=Flavobacterium daejeonense TaxID=350893 RepID=UPI000478C781|nr:IPT/TIG domain-containing protein [Flavobacterium daejeonense]
MKSPLLFILILVTLISCDKSIDEEEHVAPVILNFPNQGLLDQPINIKLENFYINKIQVFFDLEKAQIRYLSDEEIEVIVPRSIKRSNPTLKIIDLVTNETILSEGFLLKKPSITHYSTDKATFDENFIIYGDNFDKDKNSLIVTINGENAEIVSSDFSKIEVKLPDVIKKSDLEVKVRAQLQDLKSNLVLTLRPPVISNVESKDIWIGSQLTIEGENFNPDNNLGEAFVNGVPCYFEYYNKKLFITVPPGPFKDFKLTNISYKTVGQSYSFDCNIHLLNEGILVDQLMGKQQQHSVFVRNNKAYTFVYKNNNVYDYNYDYSLLEFSTATEKWTELTGFHYKGYIVDAVYDGVNKVFLYKKAYNSGIYNLSVLDLDTFSEKEIDFPFNNKIDNPRIFSFQGDLYFFDGSIYINPNVNTLSERYKYSKITNTWTLLDNSTFSELPIVNPGGSGNSNYLHYNGKLYLSDGINNKTYKVNSDLTVDTYTYSFYFMYNNILFGRSTNVFNLLYNLYSKNNITLQSNLFAPCFTLNNEVYYFNGVKSVYYQNATLTTHRLRKEVLNVLF